MIYKKDGRYIMIKLKRKPNIKEIVCMLFMAFMLSVFIAAAMTGLWSVKVHSDDRYYDLNLDVSMSGYEKNADGYYVLNGEEYQQVINIVPKWNQPQLWFSLKYVVKDAAGNDIDNDIVYLVCMDENMSENTYEAAVENGKVNNFLVPDNSVYVKLIVRGESGEQIDFKLCRIGSRQVYNEWERFFKIAGAFFAGFCVIIALIEIVLGIFGKNIPWDLPINAMSYFYEKVRWLLTKCHFMKKNGYAGPVVFVLGCIAAGVLVYQITYFKSSEAKKCLMFLMMLLCTAGCGYGVRLKWKFWDKDISDKKRRGGIKKNVLSIAFFWFSIMLCVSEIVVQGKWFGAGFMYLIMFGFMAYCMSFSNDSYDLIRYLKAGILINYIYILIQCLFMIHEIKTWGTPYYYSGINLNSALFGVNVIGPFVVLMSDLDEQLEKGKITFRYIGTSLLLGTAMLFLWACQARTMFIAEIVIGLVFFGKIFVSRRNYKNKLLLLAQLVITGVLVVAAWNGTLWGINNFALKGTQYHLKVSMLVGMEVYADDGSRIFSMLNKGLSLNKFTSGRFGMWITYLKNMNLWGHTELEYCPSADKWITPHNSILWYMYEYGALIVVPYIIMVVSFGCEAVRHAKKWVFKNKNAMLPVYTFCMLSVLGLTETIEDVFRWYTPWVLVYMIVIFLMKDDKDDKIEVRQTESEQPKRNIIYGVAVASLMLVLFKYTL